MREEPLDAFDLVERLLPGVELRPGQLAQVRAANTQLYTELFALEARARAEGRAWPGPSPTERAALRAMLVDRLREMLTEEQRPAFERLAAMPDP